LLLKRTAKVLTCLLVVLALLPLAPQRPRAQEPGGQDRRLPVKIRLSILLRVLAYDRNLAKTRSVVHVGVLCLKDDKNSEEVGKQVTKQLKAFVGHRISGLKIRATSIVVGDGEALERTVKSKDVNILYTSSGTDRFFSKIRSLASGRKLLVVSGEPHHVRKGAGVVVVQRGEKPRIIVNLKSSKQQGADFDSRLLQLSDVIR
jgi:hypothetical protein